MEKTALFVRIMALVCIGLIIDLTSIEAAWQLPQNRRGEWHPVGCLQQWNLPGAVVRVNNVLDYGASTDGIEKAGDNHRAILAAVADRDPGGLTVIYFPGGHYYLSDTLTLRAQDGVSDILLLGDGADRSRLRFDFDGGSGNCINILGRAGSQLPPAGSPLAGDARPIVRVGLENLTIERVDAGSSAGYSGMNVNIQFADGVWMRGVQSAYTARYHVYIAYSQNVEVRGCYFHHSYNYGGGGHGYGVYIVSHSRHCLVENNVFNHLRHAMILFNGARDNVFGYNLSISPYKTESGIGMDITADMCLHGRYDGNDLWGNPWQGPQRNLFEGNVGGFMNADRSHNDNGPYNTFWRNRATYYGLTIDSFSRSQNIVANQVSTADGKYGWFFSAFNIDADDCLVYGNAVGGRSPSSAECDAPPSLYRDQETPPDFFNNQSSWPPIGCSPGNPSAAGPIPAQTRWNSGDAPTVAARYGPWARAGEDQAVTGGQSVTLNGRGSLATPGGIHRAIWRQVAGEPVALDPDDGLVVAFQAPAMELENIELEFQLEVSTVDGRSSTDRVRVAVNPAGRYALGDSNGDGWVDLADALELLKCLTAQESALNRCGSLNTGPATAVYILERLAGR